MDKNGTFGSFKVESATKRTLEFGTRPNLGQNMKEFWKFEDHWAKDPHWAQDPIVERFPARGEAVAKQVNASNLGEKTSPIVVRSLGHFQSPITQPLP